MIALLCHLGYGQQIDSLHFFQAPLKIPLTTTGTFGELRTNHFHSGLDFRTKGREGVKVFAAATGYVSRIKVQLTGYGKVLYLTHNNGYTTVYAHLQKFAPAIEEYVKKHQYQRKSFEIQLFPEKDNLKIASGSLIGYSGITGGVSPHLHFEIRDAMEAIVNPLAFGFKINDALPPTVKGLRVYATNQSSFVGVPYHQDTLIAIKRVRPNFYKATPINVSGAICFGVRTYDQQAKNIYKNGIYELRVRKEGVLIYQHQLKRFSFENSKYINLLIDYPRYMNNRERYQKTYRHPKNKLQIYRIYQPQKFVIKPAEHAVFDIEILDFKQHKTTIQVSVYGMASKPTQNPQKTDSLLVITPDSPHTFEQKGIRISFPKKSVYDTVYLNLDVQPKRVVLDSPRLFPMDKPFYLAFNLGDIPTSQRQKYLIAREEKGKIIPIDTHFKDTLLMIRTKTLGTYRLLQDTEPPVVYRTNIKNGQDITSLKQLHIYAKDRLSGIKEFMARVDGRWCLMEYLTSKNLFFIDIDELPKGKHVLEVSFADACGNEVHYKRKIVLR